MRVLFVIETKQKKFVYFQNFQKSNFDILKIDHKPSLGSSDIPQKNVCPIGFAVLTFIGFKRTDRQAKVIYR